MSLHYVLKSLLFHVCWKCIYWWRSNLTIGEQPPLWPCWQALAFSHTFEEFSNIVALGALPSTCVVLCFRCQKKGKAEKNHISMVTGKLKMHQNIAKMPGMWRLWQVQVCNQELTDVRYIASTSEPLFGPTVKIINCSGINLQQTMVRYHLPPPSFLCPSLPCLFRCHQSHFASAMNTLLCPLPNILFSDGCLWNGMEKCLTVLFPSRSPPSLDLSLSLPCILQIKDNLTRIWNSTWGLVCDNGIYPWVDHLGFYVSAPGEGRTRQGHSAQIRGQLAPILNPCHHSPSIKADSTDLCSSQ